MRLPLRFLALLSCVAALAVPSAVAVAGAQTSPDDKREELQHLIGEASAQEAAALQELLGIRDRKGVIDARVAELDREAAAAEARLAPLEAEAARLAAEYGAVQARLGELQARLDSAQQALDRTAAQLYRSARVGASYDVVLASPPQEVIQGEHYLDHVSQQRRRIVRRVAELRDEIEQQRQLVESQKAAADAAEAQAQAERDRVVQLRAEMEPARAEAASQEAAEAQALEGIQARKGEFEAELAALQAASDRISAQLRAGGSGPGAPGSCEARPVPGGIVSGFGPRVHPILGSSRMHTGVDMSAGYGTPIHACRAGTVVIAGAQGGYGNTVVIDHGGGMATLYAHQSSIAVSVGQSVSSGEVIGYVGSTGMSTGPHLHFEVRLSGNPVDPTPYL
jgi:murein DD-endopeptidase MepM/ murein hydrolase activator NlpD